MWLDPTNEENLGGKQRSIILAGNVGQKCSGIN